ncbi:GNAT family N-acetyltransferase [Microlunatus speluncae]|uniref:GNAT family N-acetyltransferase n=1 Tax=Microlunatus speluncae TaxID=2594267 RepID=UPI0012662EFA|nr:N-acetyltransferase [Microlunatus speluncae]
MITRLASAAELRSFDPADPFLQWEIPADYTGPAYALGRALILARTTQTRGPGMAVLGPSGDVAKLLDVMITDDLLAEFSPINLACGAPCFDAVAERLELGPGGDWHWMWTEAAPPGVADESVIELGEVDHADLVGLIEQHNPGSDGKPGRQPGQTWLGIRGRDGLLIACGVIESNLAGRPLLSGITVHADHRGRGLGRTMTSALTRRAVAAHGVCTLGVYAANTVALRLYESLGFRIGHRWRSRRLIGLR